MRYGEVTTGCQSLSKPWSSGIQLFSKTYMLWYMVLLTYNHLDIFLFLNCLECCPWENSWTPTRGLEFERGLYVRKIFLRTAMLRMWYNYDITLLQKGLFNKIISREKNENLYIQYVFYYILQIFYMISQSLFYGCCPSSERCSSCASR